MEINKDSKNNYNGIDLMKFLCAILVITIHIEPFPLNCSITWLNFFVNNCIARIAVPLFFIASSFFLFKKLKNNMDTKIFGKYLKRIIFLYIAWTIIYIPLIIYKKYKYGLILGIIMLIRDTIFDGSYVHLWYLQSLIVSSTIVFFYFKKNNNKKILLFMAIVLYVIGLLGQSWFGFLKPIKNVSPQVWQVLLLIKNIIVTTRNGIFFGLIFTLIGYYFATNEKVITKKKNILMIIIFLILLIFECYILKHLNFARAHDMYLTLIPLSFYVFNYFKDIKLDNKKIYIYMRKISSLVYFIHMWIAAILKLLLRNVLNDWYIVFYLTVIISIFLSLLIIKLSKKYTWLKYLY